MIYHELKDSEGQILSSNIIEFSEANLFQDKEQENVSISNIKNIYRMYSHGSVRLIATHDEKQVVTSRIATRTADSYAQMILSIKKMRDDSNYAYTILRHNLVTTHSKLQGEIGSIISEEQLIQCEDHAAQRKLALEAIQSNPDISANSFLEITKRIVDLQSQIKGFEMLGGEVELDIDEHNIKRLLLNILYPFYGQFKDQSIIVNVNIDDDAARQHLVKVDYQVFNIAMHHFLNNIVKYAKPYSKITVLFDDKNKLLRFVMTSVRIEREELKTIFDLKRSGKNAGNLAGDGIGMYMVQKSLDLLSCQMDIIPDYGQQEVVGDIPYVKNEFRIHFSNL